MQFIIIRIHVQYKILDYIPIHVELHYIEITFEVDGFVVFVLDTPLDIA